MTATIDMPNDARGSSFVVAVAVPVVCIGIIVTAALTLFLSLVGLLVGIVLTVVAVVVRVRTFGASTDLHILDAFATVDALEVDAAANLCNLAEGLATSVGVATPELRVLDDAGCNTLVVDNGKGRTALVVTTGLLEALSRVELEGVVARALVQIRQGDAAAAVARIAIDRAPDVKVIGTVFGGGSRFDDPDRDVLLDRAAASATRYPPGLMGALDQCRQRTTAVAGADPATTSLWLADPTGGGSLDHRIEALELL